MRNTKYYAVYGEDGFGVYTSISWAKKISDYLRSPEIVMCSSLSQAFCIARDNYNDYQMGYNVDASYDGGSLDIQLNHVLFRRDIMKMNISS